MAIHPKLKFSYEEIEFAMAILLDRVGFAMHFWASDMTIPHERDDLPEEWRGNQIITLEQLMMACDGADYALFHKSDPSVVNNSSQLVLARTSRKTGKTLLGFESQYIQIAITHTGEPAEGLFHAPSEVHIKPVLARIDNMVDKTPFFKMMHRKRNVDSGIDSYHSGYTWHRRIEAGETGRNMVGLRAIHVLGDEADYSSKAAHEERMQTALPTAYWFWGGVPRAGIRSQFWKVARTEEGAIWSRHVQGNYRLGMRYDLRANPIYHSQKAWRNELKGQPLDHDRVQTQVFGLDGGAGTSAFVDVPRKAIPFYYGDVSVVDLRDVSSMDMFVSKFRFDDVEEIVPWTMHIDYGFSPSPMIIGISYWKDNIWWEFARIRAMRMHAVAAAQLINAFDLALPMRPEIIVIDAHGRGAGVYEVMHESDEFAAYNYKQRLQNADFHTVLDDPRIFIHRRCNRAVKPVDMDEYGEVYTWMCEMCGENYLTEKEVRPKRTRAKELYTTYLGEALTAGQRFVDEGVKPTSWGVVLAERDDELIVELEGTVAHMMQSGAVRYEPPGGDDEDHNTDAWRALVAVQLRLTGEERARESWSIIEEYGLYDTTPVEERRMPQHQLLPMW